MFVFPFRSNTSLLLLCYKAKWSYGILYHIEWKEIIERENQFLENNVSDDKYFMC